MSDVGSHGPSPQLPCMWFEPFTCTEVWELEEERVSTAWRCSVGHWSQRQGLLCGHRPGPESRAVRTWILCQPEADVG